jgi:tetraacyldisaccharide 4'-kinase
MFEQMWRKIIRSYGFSPWRLLQPILWLLSVGYRAGLALRRWTAGPPVELTIPVLSVGNITVGGAGKTPLVLHIARKLTELNVRVGIVASGYGRSGDEPLLESGRILSRRDAHQIGDEVKLLATRLPDVLFAIDRTKTLAARKLAATGSAQVIIVDDGFQHCRLKRNLDIVALDTSVRPRLHRLLPGGILREPLAGLQRADIVILTRTDLCDDRRFFDEITSGLPASTAKFSAQFVLEELIGPNQRIAITSLRGRRVLLFAGIGNFAALQSQVETLCGGPVTTMELGDHQSYDRSLVERIRRAGEAAEADLFVTTEKDWMKVSSFDFGHEIYYVAQKVELEPGGDQLIEMLTRRLGLTITGH